MAEKRGGKRPGAGRPNGRKNRATEDQKGALDELARSYTEIALDALVRIARSSASDAASVSAAVAILDRGYGKPRQGLEVTGPNGGPVHTITAAMTPKEAADAYAATLNERCG